MSGVLFRSDTGETVIGVNDSHSPTRQRFTIAHELGHFRLHPDTLYLDGFVRRDDQSSLAVSRHEIEANAFAAELLMPREQVLEELNASLQRQPDADPGKLVRRLARMFDVSEQAMEFRLLNLGVATSV
jgi:Zn-dependent peptidase ImmA (M78 family)